MTIEMSLMSLILVALLVAALVVASLAWRKREVDRRRTAMEGSAAALGLEPVDATDPDLNERFARLQRECIYLPKIALAWKREEADGRIYLLELWIEEENTPRRIVGGHVLVVSPRLAMPRFGILATFDLPGIIPGLVRQFQGYVADRVGRVPVENHPEFNSRYTVVGEDPAAIRQFLTESRLRELARLKHRRLEAGGDMFSYSRPETGSPGDPALDDRFGELLDEARLLCRIFQAEAAGQAS